MLRVQYTEVCVEDYHSGEQYGDWHRVYDFNVRGVCKSSREEWGIGYEEEEVDIDGIDVGDTVYVLWMTYRTGDTFGHSEGNGEIIWVFKDKERAEAAYEIWKEQAREDNYSIQFLGDDGKQVTMSNPASGYFEDLGHMSLDSFVVSE